MHNENFTKINNVKNKENFSVSYADALKSSGASTKTSENSVGFETCFQTVTLNLYKYDKYYGIHAKHNAGTVEATKPNTANPLV